MEYHTYNIAMSFEALCHLLITLFALGFTALPNRSEITPIEERNQYTWFCTYWLLYVLTVIKSLTLYIPQMLSWLPLPSLLTIIVYIPHPNPIVGEIFDLFRQSQCPCSWSDISVCLHTIKAPLAQDWSFPEWSAKHNHYFVQKTMKRVMVGGLGKDSDHTYLY